MIDEVNFKNLLIADFYIRFREEINKKGMFEQYSKKEIADTGGLEKAVKSFFQAPDAMQKLEQIATKVFDEVRKLDATQHILNKKEKYEGIKKAFFEKFKEKQDFSDTDFLDLIDENADGHEFFKQFAILVKKDGKISEWEKQAIYQLGQEFKLTQKDIDKYFKSNKGLIIALISIIVVAIAVFFALQNKNVKETIDGFMGSVKPSESQPANETPTVVSEPETTVATKDYNVKFNEYEVKQKLDKKVAFYVGSFKQTVDAEKEKDFFEDFKVGERQIILPVQASFRYVIYFDEIGEIVCDENGVVKFTLPPIHLVEEWCDVDWPNVKEKVSWTRKSFTPEEKNRMKNAAEKYLVDVAEKNYNYRSKAISEAERWLTSFFATLGFKVIIYKNTNVIIDKK